MNKQEMLSLINKYDVAYYENNHPLVSDSEYDRLRNEYISKYGTKDLNYIPSDENHNFAKRKHDFDMMSLEKVKLSEVGEIEKYFEKFGGKVMIQPKIDGLTLVDYQNNIRVSRGTGIQGDILPLANKIKMGSAPGYVVRGEAYIDKKTFIEINESREKNCLALFENARNAAAGILHNLDDGRYYPIHFLAYEIRKKDENIKNHCITYKDDVELLKKFGYETPETWYFDDFDELIDFVQTFDKNSLTYDIDGLVMKCLDENSYAKYGVTGHHPKDSIAIKFPPEQKKTKIIDVEFSLGRTKITPVAVLEPVRLAGTKVERASIHNFDWIEEKHLMIGSVVTVEKANEIIPQVVEVLEDGYKEIEIPRICPVCGHEIVRKDAMLYCTNDACMAKMKFHIRYIASKPALDIRGLSEKTAEKIINTFNFKSWHDIFDITKEQLLTVPGFAEKSAQKLADNIQKSKRHVSLATFLYCLGVDNVGRSTANDIADYLKTYDNLVKEVKNKCINLKNVSGIGEVVAYHLSNALDDIEKLHEYIIPEDAEESNVKEDALTIVVTGTFDKPRSYFEELITSHGHVFGNSITKKTDYLLVGEKAGGNKLKAAEKNNVKVIYSEDELLKILK